jgi:shikimate kinase
MKRIGLIGFSGSGKSSIAEMAEKKGYKTADTDRWIQSESGDGAFEQLILEDETPFREMESDVIRKIIKTDVQIVAFGGGFHYLHKAFSEVESSRIKLVYLKESFDELFNRAADRPLFKKLGTEGYRKLFDQRMPLYEKCADFTVETKKRSVNDIWFEVEKIWNLISL